MIFFKRAFACWILLMGSGGLMSDVMKACAINEFGGNEVIEYLDDVKVPECAAHSVLVQNHYAAVNPVDWKIREGYFAKRFKHDFPLILGRDFCGEIVKVGKGVSKYKVGDRVCGYLPFGEGCSGTFAEYVSAPEEFVCRVPSEVSETDAASFPLVGLTAWQGIFEQIKLKSGEHFLVLGGTTSVGNLAVQLAKEQGAEVYATAGKNNFPLLRSLGVEHCIDYAMKGLTSIAPDSIDGVYDCVGSEEEIGKALDLVKKGGQIISICIFGFPEHLVDRAAQKGVTLKSYVLHPNDGQTLQKIMGLIQTGKLILRPIELFAFSEIPLALAKSQDRHPQAKMVVKIGDAAL